MPDKVKALQLKEQGNSFFAKQQYAKAVECYEAAVQFDPEIKEIWFNLGLTFKKMHRSADAIDALTKAIAIDATYVKALWHRSDILVQQYRFQDALIGFDQILEVQSDNLDALASREQCLDHIQAKVCAVTVDLKATQDGSIKILSLHRALQTSFAGYDELNSQSMEESFKQKLTQLGLPFFINSSIGKPCVFADDGFFESSLVCGQAWPPKPCFDYSDLSTYKGIYGGQTTKSITNKQILLIDDSMVWLLGSESPDIIHQAFSDDLLEYRPVCKTYPRQYGPGLAAQIKRDIPGNKYVIYTTDLYGDRGLVLVDEAQLDTMLRLLLTKDNLSERIAEYFAGKQRDFADKPNAAELWARLGEKTTPVATWSTSCSPTFIVEQCVAAKPIMKEKKRFEPTMRVAVLVVRDKQAVTAIPIDGYWKLPRCPIGQGELPDCRLASFGGSIGEFSVLASAADKAMVFSQLTQILPRVFTNLFRLNIRPEITRLLSSDAEAIRYGIYLLMLQANSYGFQGRSVLALNLINQAIRLAPGDSKAYHERGLIYHNKGDYLKAIEDFSQALTIGPVVATYYRRGRSYFELGKTEETMQDFLAAKRMTPGDGRIDVEIARLSQYEGAKALGSLEIDLHGFSVETAKARVLHTLATTHNISKIRVITGRGNHPNKHGERGILYREFHSWITESAYQHRIEKITNHDGYYEIYLNHEAAQHVRQFLLSTLGGDIQQIRILADQGDTNNQFLFATYLVVNAKDDDNYKQAFRYYLQAARQHHVEAMVEVAASYMMGRGTRQNDREAVSWLLRAIEFDEFHVPLLLGECCWFGHGIEQDYTVACNYYQIAVNHNNPIAMRKLANAYKTGYGREINSHHSFALYKRAANLGEVTSQFNVAIMYENGLGVLPDKNQAINYFLRAANGGDPDAQGKIGYCYLVGDGVAADKQQASYWLTLADRNGCAQASALLSRDESGTVNFEMLARSAQAGNIWAEVELQAHRRGIDIRDGGAIRELIRESYQRLRDIDITELVLLEHKSKFLLIDLLQDDTNKCYRRKAIAVLTNMARDNCVFSLRRLAYAYHSGNAVAKNPRQGIAYLEQASQLQDGKATRLLGYAHIQGDGVRKSVPRGLEYFHQAAALNEPVANYELGIWYCRGSMVAKDLGRGIVYLEQAISLENDSQIIAHLDSGLGDRYVPIKHKAALRLGVMYLDGEVDGCVDVARALEYFRQAQEWGSKKSAKILTEYAAVTHHDIADPIPVTSTTAEMLQRLGASAKKAEPTCQEQPQIQANDSEESIPKADVQLGFKMAYELAPTVDGQHTRDDPDQSTAVTWWPSNYCAVL